MAKRRININQKKDSITIKDGFDLFIKYRKVILEIKPKTEVFYKERYQYFTQFIDENTLCKDITEDTFNDYKAFLIETKPDLRKNSRINYLKAIRTFLYYLMDEGYTKSFSISLPQEEEVFKENYTPEEIAKLLEKPKSKSFAEWRNWAIINFIYGTSARSRTTRLMKIEDIDFDNDLVFYMNTKSGKPQAIPLSPYLKEVLKEYIALFEDTEEEYLFPNVYGGAMSENTFKLAVKNYNRSRGVMKTSPHLLRHTFATQYCANGGSESKLQKILGHSTPKMTQHYIHMSGRDLKSDFDEYSPLERQMVSKKKTSIKIKRKN